MFICFKVLEHGTAIADLDNEQELTQRQQDTRSTSLCTSDMSDLKKSGYATGYNVCQQHLNSVHNALWKV